MNKELISIGEAAKKIGVSIDTLRRWDKNGLLHSIRGTEKGHRYYRTEDLELFVKDLFMKAQEWVKSTESSELDQDLYCQTVDVFQSRLFRMQNELMKRNDLKTPFSLIVAAAGEMGNNSYDHNLGNWRDIPGIFFGYDLNKKQIVLADRGQGILRTLKRVRPELKTDEEALRVAFTEIISGRAPEARGNGLKYVRKIIVSNPLKLLFYTGEAKLSLQQGDHDLNISHHQPLLGCIAAISFSPFS